jgi:hypothetical protein
MMVKYATKSVDALARSEKQLLPLDFLIVSYLEVSEQFMKRHPRQANHMFIQWSTISIDTLDDRRTTDFQDDEHDDLDVDAFDGTSVIKTIRRYQETEGVQFNVDDDIDAWGIVTEWTLVSSLVYVFYVSDVRLKILVPKIIEGGRDTNMYSLIPKYYLFWLF